MEETIKRKIVLIGPVYPYKGGIAHYTSLLYRALSKKYDVEMISYKMQYPKFLFKKEQKDFSNDMFRVDDAKFLIHTANPFNIVNVGRKIRKEHPYMVIIQWWHPYFAPCYWLLEKMFGKKIKKVFICHNVFPHERFPMDRFLTKLVLKNGDAFIVHSKSDGEDLLTIKQNAVFKQNPHPTYNAFKIKNLTKEQARKELHKSNEEKILLFFGFVREYKGLKHLLYAMPQIRDQIAHVKLLVVGSFGDDKEAYMQIIEEQKITDCVEVIDGYTPDDEVEKYFAACDLVVLPYESATQSGIVQIACGFEKPVIVTNVGGLPDVVEDGKTGYVVEPKNPKALSEKIVDYFVQNKETEFVRNVREEAYRFDWDRMVEKIEAL
ncbi:MAG: glycosyltransferase family 4 protein [Lachnospiraceae bacterium]|nr:glycosyltransferase family 4 protein [Lachnospiraceae bacterium]